MDVVLLVLVWFVLFGAVGALIGKRKGRQVAGLAWAMVLGPVGWLVVWLGPTVDADQARRARGPVRKINTMNLPRR